MSRKAVFVLPILAAMMAALPASCSSGVSTRDFADRYIAAENKAWDTGDLEDLKALETADVVYHLNGTDLVGWKAHEKYIVDARPTLSQLKQTWKYLSGQGSHVILSYKISAIQRGAENTPPMTLSGRYLFALKLNAGKITEVWAEGSTTSTPADPL